MVNYENDYEYGEEQEQKVFKILEEGFEWDTPLKKGTRYSKYDYPSYNHQQNLQNRLNQNLYSPSMKEITRPIYHKLLF
jgi:hypothetical protein